MLREPFNRHNNRWKMENVLPEAELVEAEDRDFDIAQKVLSTTLSHRGFSGRWAKP